VALRKIRYRKEALADVNMTNLIDIMIVLLIVFILVSNFVQTGLNIRVPEVSYVEAMGKEQIVVGVDPNGRKTLNGQPVTDSDLPVKLAELKNQFPDEALFINADKLTSFGDVAEVIAISAKVGFQSVNIPAIYKPRS